MPIFNGPRKESDWIDPDEIPRPVVTYGFARGCERRKSSSSILGMRTSDQTCRSPRHQAISVRNSF